MRTSKELTSKVIEQFNKLFIVTKHSYIYENSYREKYKTDNLYYRSKYPINDTALRKHIDGIQTCGILADKYSKFITFDVDTKERSKVDTKHLIKVLQEEFNIKKRNIHVVFSGRKGYHVYIHFSNPTKVVYLRKFYYDVIQKANFNTQQIEFRPSTSAIKLPLGKHPVTKKRSWYVDTTTLEPMRSLKPILNITTISNEFINKTYYNDLSTTEQEIFLNLANSMNLDKVLLDENRNSIKSVLENNMLEKPNTRHIMTLLIGCYLKSQGYDMETTKQFINGIMYNTLDNRIGFIDTPRNRIESKTSSQINSIYKLDYKYSQSIETLSFSVEEIKDVLEVRNTKLMKLYLAHRIHSKRYANLEDETYYMTYEQLKQYNVDSNRGRTLEQISKLSDRIEIVSRNRVDLEKTKQNGKVLKEPNRYKLKKKFESNVGSITIESRITLEELLIKVQRSNLIDLKPYLSRDLYYKVKKQCS
ncbi:TOTE conflict system archaeo-eukaryotic primase domain-containing protein [Staphylococcus saprophyticus]|uniref:TOTE conflict system archaeo-eukaryotic primase domain-containing protein n=1 Tax=Staphylococcus saprophyticus TaxID=29385 RepID=UPI0021A5551E|nr:hypothetical protein [Staphylococcus saprophyticus]MCT1652865.1 hypothetical protein [Staphylococcus saprophyticus]